jgi:hypothetical protein
MELDLQTLVSHFGEVLQYAERYCVTDDCLTCGLCELFGMKYAYMIRACVGEPVGTELAGRVGYEEMEGRSDSRRRLPKSDEARVPARKLFSAVASGDKAGILSALDGMGVLALCPMPRQQFSRMERVAGRVIGRAKLVFLVELAFFAAEVEDYERASQYASEAHDFNPVAWELYSLSVIEGLVALNAGKIDEAVKYLAKSVNACLTDVSACLGCGISPPNFLLAKKLFERGERIEVLRHLLDCKAVWRILRVHIEEWIRVIESGRTPDVGAGGTWRLAIQCRNASLIDSGQDLAEVSLSLQSRDQVIAEVERMRAEFKLPKNIPVPNSVKERGLIGRWPGSE